MSRNREGYHKEYYAKNKEKVLAKNKEYKDTHKDEAKIRRKEFYEASKDEYHTLYLLQNCNYVGVTNNLKQRIIQHTLNGKDCSNHIVLYKTKNREVALKLESLLHDEGFDGRHAFNSYK